MVQIANSPTDGQKGVCLSVGLTIMPLILADNNLSHDSCLFNNTNAFGNIFNALVLRLNDSLKSGYHWTRLDKC